MSAATDEIPDFVLPERVHQRARLRVVAPGDSVGAGMRAPDTVGAGAGAGAVSLHRPADSSVAAPMRLTRRGILVLGAAVGLVCTVLVALAWLSAPAGAGHSTPSVTGDSVAVSPGDTLWSIAGRIAPNRDPRAEVALLQRINHLDGSALVPGQVLRTH